MDAEQPGNQAEEEVLLDETADHHRSSYRQETIIIQAGSHSPYHIDRKLIMLERVAGL